MIGQITELPLQAEDYHSAKLCTYFRAYGTGYDFCRFYRSQSAYIMIFNSNAVVCGECDDETACFIGMSGAATAEMQKPRDIAGFSVHTVYHMTRRQANSADIIFDDISADRLRGIVGASFAEMDFSAWYCDLSHRIRHGVSQGFLYGSSFAAADMETQRELFLSAVSTAPAHRKRGNMRALLDGIRTEKCLSVMAEESMMGFYLHLGFETAAQCCYAVRSS